MRRSLAIGGSLTRADTERLLDACQSLLEPPCSASSEGRGVTRWQHNELAPVVRQTPAGEGGWDSADPNLPPIRL